MPSLPDKGKRDSNDEMLLLQLDPPIFSTLACVLWGRFFVPRESSAVPKFIVCEELFAKALVASNNDCTHRSMLSSLSELSARTSAGSIPLHFGLCIRNSKEHRASCPQRSCTVVNSGINSARVRRRFLFSYRVPTREDFLPSFLLRMLLAPSVDDMGDLLTGSFKPVVGEDKSSVMGL